MEGTHHPHLPTMDPTALLITTVHMGPMGLMDPTALLDPMDHPLLHMTPSQTRQTALLDPQGNPAGGPCSHGNACGARCGVTGGGSSSGSKVKLKVRVKVAMTPLSVDADVARAQDVGVA